jgi:hypothetical protein
MAQQKSQLEHVERVASLVQEAVTELNQRMLVATKAGLRVEYRIRRPDKLSHRVFVDATVSLELGTPEPDEI